jgi:hypothetical protein
MVHGLGGNVVRVVAVPRTEAALRGVEAAMAVLLPRQGVMCRAGYSSFHTRF